MGIGSFFQNIADEKKERETTEIVNSLMNEFQDDPKNPESRKKIAGIICRYLATGKTQEALETAEKFSMLFGDEFTNFFLPVCSVMDYLDGATFNPAQFERKHNPKICKSLINPAKEMDGYKVDDYYITTLFQAVKDFKDSREEVLRKRASKDSDSLKDVLKSDTSMDRINVLINHMNEVLCALFVYKCVAYNKESYKMINYLHKSNVLKNSDYAIPGPNKAPALARFNFMSKLSKMEDFDELFAIYSLICGYQDTKGNKVSVSGKKSTAKIKLSPQPLFYKSCNIKFSFSGKKHRQFVLTGKIDLKKNPELLTKASEFKVWKISEKKPTVIELNYALKDAEFFEKRSEIQTVTEKLNTENSIIFEGLSVKK